MRESMENCRNLLQVTVTDYMGSYILLFFVLALADSVQLCFL